MVFMAEAISVSPQEVYTRSIIIEADMVTLERAVVVSGAAFDLAAYPPPQRRS
jgi:hypothetical protein